MSQANRPFLLACHEKREYERAGKKGAGSKRPWTGPFTAGLVPLEARQHFPDAFLPTNKIYMNFSMDKGIAPLSVIMPIYNERSTLDQVIAAVLEQACVKELICVDDHSSDGSRERLIRWAEREPRVKVLLHDRNRGKGASLQTAIRHVSGPFTVFQDADLEYDPADYAKLIAPLLEGTADVVYGSRFGAQADCQAGYRAHRLVNWLLTTISNQFTRLGLSDVETCYKVFRTDILHKLSLRETGFSIDPEITAKLAKRRYRILEVPIRYRGRAFSDGKKITWKDGVKAVGCMARYGLWG